MEIVEPHLQNALGDRDAGRFLDRFGIILEKEQRERKGCGRSDQSPRHGFGQVADAGFFRVGHGVRF